MMAGAKQTFYDACEKANTEQKSDQYVNRAEEAQQQFHSKVKDAYEQYAKALSQIDSNYDKTSPLIVHVHVHPDEAAKQDVVNPVPPQYNNP